MNILIIGINYAPEETGIAIYTSGLSRELARRGHNVVIICSPPHFPRWRVQSGYSARRFMRQTDEGVRLIRCPLYVPSTTGGLKRILHYLSFAVSSFPVAVATSLKMKPELVISVAPSLLAAPVARLAAAMAGARSWLHVQDLEIDAAIATGVLKPEGIASRLGYRFERWVLRSFDVVSAISAKMCERIRDKGVSEQRIVELRNWADLDGVRPSDQPSSYREEWSIKTPYVALYSGSLGNKQGIEILVDVAGRLRMRTDLTFVICGEGPSRINLEQAAKGLGNIIFKDLQPRTRLGDLMSLATVHLMPQIANAADLVLPSKLGNMMASGRPIVATAARGTGLWEEISSCGVATAPGDAAAFGQAISELLDDGDRRSALGHEARLRAERLLSFASILDKAEASMMSLVDTGRI